MPKEKIYQRNAGSLVLEEGEKQTTDEQTNGRTENKPILLDLVLYWGRCPKRKQAAKMHHMVLAGSRGLRVERPQITI